ncbi:hypothetical protein [Paenibacillus sp. MBLB4367]|uniref:hypothetical protein n=1 Tax=Paenibacillus sp. MBLB4367 TaxID=3384767 RepID=UPI003907FA8E
MKRKSITFLCIGLLVFGLLIALAIWQQSAYLLYAASAVPLLIVPFIPDIRSNQHLKASRKDNVQIYKLATIEGAPANHLIVQFEPGKVNWNRKMLYVSMKDAPTVAKDVFAPDSASVPVLTFDLVLHKRKSDLIGILLQNVKQRTSSFSFTTEEITRLVIRLEDLAEPAAPARSIAAAQTRSKRMQA